MNFKRTIVIAVILLLLGTFYFFYEVKGRKAREEAKNKESALFLADAEKITRISFKRDEEGKPSSFEFAKQGNRWQLVKPVEAPADEFTLNGLIQGISMSKKEAVIRENATPKDLEQFGLKNPSIKLNVFQDSEQSAVLLGDLTIDGKSIYAMYPGKGQIFIISSGLKNYLERKPDDYRDKTVLSIKMDDLSKIALNGEYDTYLFENKNNSWVISQPDVKRQSPKEITSFIQSLLNTRAVAFYEDTSENRKNFGLDDVKVYCEFYRKNVKEPVVLKIGNVDPRKGQVYAMVEDSRQIYGLNRVERNKFENRPSNFVRRAIIEDTPDKISNVTVILKDKTLRLEKTISDKKNPEGSFEVWTMKEPLNKKIDNAGVIALLRMSAGLFATDATGRDKSDAFYGLDKPYLILKGSRDDKKELFNVKFGKISEDPKYKGMYYCQVNDEDVIVLVNAPALQGVVRIITELMAGRNPVADFPEEY